LNIGNMKFAPMTSVEGECSFSRYKSVFWPNRRSFNFENLSMYIVSHCYINYKFCRAISIFFFCNFFIFHDFIFSSNIKRFVITYIIY
jgi:hypothetical protein